MGIARCGVAPIKARPSGLVFHTAIDCLLEAADKTFGAALENASSASGGLRYRHYLLMSSIFELCARQILRVMPIVDRSSGIFASAMTIKPPAARNASAARPAATNRRRHSAEQPRWLPAASPSLVADARGPHAGVPDCNAVAIPD